MYADLQDRVIKIGPTIGNCAFSPPAGPAAGSDVLDGQNAAQLTVDTGVKATAPKRVRRGSRFTLRLKVANSSSTLAHTPTVVDTLPRGTTFVRALSSKGVSCQRRGNRSMTCRRNSLAGAQSFTVKIVVKAMRGSRYTNSANVRSKDLDARPGNNVSRSRTKVMRR
jgi:uncharacterized repeat protein (TIGR01451 family)